MEESLLKELTDKFSPSGGELSVHAIIKSELIRFVDRIDSLKNGSLVAIKKGFPGKCSLMLDAHIDEVFAVITGITEDGFLRFFSESIDQKIFPGSIVIVHGQKPIKGIIGIKPAHLVTEEETKKAMEINELFIDCGFNKKDIEEIVAVGDFVSFNPNFSKIGNCYSNKSFDDKLGAYVIIEVIKRLKRINPLVNIICHFSSQEEENLYGAITSTYALKPDFAIAIDVTHATSPGVSADEAFEIGNGPAIFVGPSVDRVIVSKLIKTAENFNIPFSKEIDIFSGTDAIGIQTVQEGVPVAVVSIPLRYMHTPVETADQSDIENTVNLLVQFIGSIDDSFMEELYGEH